MTAWTETYRGIVKAWECDTFAHFTIAYYFDRLADCSAAMTTALGASAWQTDRLIVGYLKELRGGDGLHAESAVLTSAPDRLVLAHQIFNSVTGDVVSQVEQGLVPGAGAAPIASRPPLEGWRAATPTDTAEPPAFVPTGRDLVKPDDVDAEGRLTWSAYVHRFSGCGPHLLPRIGVTPQYLRDNKQGFSTFETRLTLVGPRPRVGDLVRMRSGILKMGKSSISLVHQMLDGRTDSVIASLHQSGVQLDMVARKSNPWPDDVRRAGEALVSGTAS
jgi:acyl-CoA thioesterase FadM